jgi:hypothetical protein
LIVRAISISRRLITPTGRFTIWWCLNGAAVC